MKPEIGIFMKTKDPAFVEAAGWAGLDFVILDMEHGPVGFETLENLIRAAECSGISAIVRLPDFREELVGQVLDLGAKGAQVPKIQTADEARKVVVASRFGIGGERGVCRFVRAAKYSRMPREEYLRTTAHGRIIIHLEGVEAINNLDEIAAVEGIDVLFIGPYDLSNSLGIPGQVDHPSVIDLMSEAVQRAKSFGKTVGTFADTPEALKRWADAGVGYIAYSTDVGLFSDTCADLARMVKT
jgi:4-hydroxy-2-oxoheptanedioate aldolase